MGSIRVKVKIDGSPGDFRVLLYRPHGWVVQKVCVTAELAIDSAVALKPTVLTLPTDSLWFTALSERVGDFGSNTGFHFSDTDIAGAKHSTEDKALGYISFDHNMDSVSARRKRAGNMWVDASVHGDGHGLAGFAYCGKAGMGADIVLCENTTQAEYIAILEVLRRVDAPLVVHTDARSAVQMLRDNPLPDYLVDKSFTVCWQRRSATIENAICDKLASYVRQGIVTPF